MLTSRAGRPYLKAYKTAWRKFTWPLKFFWRHTCTCFTKSKKTVISTEHLVAELGKKGLNSAVSHLHLSPLDEAQTQGPGSVYSAAAAAVAANKFGQAGPATIDGEPVGRSANHFHEESGLSVDQVIIPIQDVAGIYEDGVKYNESFLHACVDW